ncbi:MAG: metallophosphoesterase family protein [Methanosarcina sp.]|nr:metallophosphoesterase family protein [Methanosarcina sp.]MDW5550858.1 metallophosphoesterase family protein [Methanosarcina sp.]MDW5554680.1 metallophosphoesterase family protein [Methanosarcina sp.]MDW5560467.1 metallophosphoesterase family protein [Methanosarcina sp.]
MVHLSDIHYSDAYFVPEIAESMVDSINQLEPNLVVITGDLTDNGFSAEYDGVKRFIDRIECKNKILVPGNHDSKNAGYVHFEDLFTNRYFSQNFEDVTVVGADSSQPDLDEGHLGRENYGWIKEAFSGENFKVFAMHHHLVPIPLAGRENTVLVDAGDVLELLNRCKVNLVLCGHCHIPWVWNLNNMLVVNAGTFCSSKTRGKTTQCYNLIQANKENSNGNWKVRVSRVFSKGDRELVTETVM